MGSYIIHRNCFFVNPAGFGTYFGRMQHILLQRRKRKGSVVMNYTAHRVLSILRAILISYVFTGIVLLILAFLLMKTEVSYNFLRGGMIFSYLFSSLVAGFAAGHGARARRFLWGMAAGFLYFAILFLVSFLMNNMLITAPGTMAMIFVMCTLGGMFGGMFS